jgi:hypothetical protein
MIYLATTGRCGLYSCGLQVELLSATGVEVVDKCQHVLDQLHATAMQLLRLIMTSWGTDCRAGQ